MTRPLVLAEPSVFQELRDVLWQCRLAIQDARDLIRLSREPSKWTVRNLHRSGRSGDVMRRVLLFESDLDTAEMYAVGLRMEGFAAAVAPDLASALEHIRRGQPDALVAEVSEAARDDWQIVRWCRQGESGRAVPVVLLTGHPPTAIPATASALGCAALLKPCLPATLAQVIRGLLAADEDRQTCS